ncbi:3-oxoacyl-ACP reductase FabG [uncultured Secundilactobacillus sp.]|uniref:3-oxoacyl-ACP reductase FabG n=1 Tax=uncultured Secundilactobacillus sp. TaxID=2813935 RepID=UPI00258DB3D2|nr:3-oxoacyl-ACP reductase FabG [uncultured Secundilactobacillus sp.]
MADGVVLITGGNRGIGLAIAERLAGDGENVVITTRHELPESQLATLDSLGIHTVVGDVTDEAEAQRMINDAMKHGEWLRGLINNAGINRDKLMTRMSTEDFIAVLQTNLVGAFNMSKPALKLMQKQRQGSIIHMASVVGLTGNVGQANYAASKAGLIGLMKTIAKEGGLRQVRSNAIAPGMVETDMTDALSDKTKEAILAEIPAKRFAKPAEIADVCAFLLNNEYVTGQVITIDGGLTL